MEEGDLRVNGHVYDPNTLTFREQREVKRIVRDDIFEGEMPPEDDLGIADTMPAVILVLVRRDNPEYTLDEAMDLALNDILVTADDVKQEKSAKRPPTQRSRTPKKTSGVSGAQT